MGRARDAILDALENLAPEELKKFKMKLLSVPLRQGFGRIPRGPLLQMDAIDLTDKLVSYYMEAYATELTMAVLTDMGMQELAKELQKVFTTGGECGRSLVPAAYPHVPAADQRPVCLAQLCFSYLTKKKKKPFPLYP